MEFHMINITYAALHMRAQTEKTTFSCKDDCTLTKHTALDIFRFAVVFFVHINVSYQIHFDDKVCKLEVYFRVHFQNFCMPFHDIELHF